MDGPHTHCCSKSLQMQAWERRLCYERHALAPPTPSPQPFPPKGRGSSHCTVSETQQQQNMREVVSSPPAVVHNETARIQALFQQNVVPTYSRFDLALSHGSGSYVYDVAGKRYLDLGGGIAVCCLGHANPEITEALLEQSKRIVHISNLYYNEPQGRLAREMVNALARGKVFFCNSGAEADE